MKDDIGLFDHPMPRADRLSRIGDPALRAQATGGRPRRPWCCSKTSRNTLPLAPARVRRLLVVGPSADSRANLCGGWTLAWQGRPEAQCLRPKMCPPCSRPCAASIPQATVETLPYRDCRRQAAA